MVRLCYDCYCQYDDEYRTTICPHGTFAANDGKNNFAHHEGSVLLAPEDQAYQSIDRRARFEQELETRAVAIVVSEYVDAEFFKFKRQDRKDYWRKMWRRMTCFFR